MEKALWKRKLVNKLGLRQWQLYLLILPALVFLVLFCYLPMYGVAFLSFSLYSFYNEIAFKKRKKYKIY